MTVNLDVARQLTISIATAFKSMSAQKRRLPRPHPSADQASVHLLHALEAEPLRIGALAEAVHSDISTVSRQTSALTAGGLVTKVSDPDDRRVQLVALTDEGHKLTASLREQRSAWMQDLLADWDTDEAQEFMRYLDKLSASLAAYDERHNFAHHTSTEGKIA